MHSIRFYHWLVVLTLALLLHAAFLWAYPNQEDKGLIEATQDSGVVAFEIGLATETIKQNLTPPQPKPKPPVEPKVVETPPPKPEPTPVVEPEMESDVAIAPIKEPVREVVEPKPEPDPIEPVEEVVVTKPPAQEPVIEVVPKQVVAMLNEAPQEIRESMTAGGSKGLQEDYHAKLSAWLEKHKSYPRRAKRRGQEGTAFLRFKIDRDGQLISHQIAKSSGYSLLDKEVERMLRRASPLPAIPHGMKLSELELTIPVSFQLR